jgi:hypothetical protein
MGLVSPSQSNAGDEITAAKINNPVNQLAAVVNGNIDANNIADSSVSTVKIADNAVTAAKLATTAITLGYAEASASQTIASTAETDLTSLTVTVTVPAGGRRCKITGYIPDITSGAADNSTVLRLKESTTNLVTSTYYLTLNKDSGQRIVMYSAVLSAGSHTYKLTAQHSAVAAADYIMSATSKGFILVEAI